MRLPSLNALRAFEAAARHESFARAAHELCVTEGAVSRHIKVLEEEMGVTLFRRMTRKVELTEQGREFLPVVGNAFASIASGAARIAAPKASLKIACDETLSIRWLVPRLERFRVKHPEIGVQFTAKYVDDEEFARAEYDVRLGGGCGLTSDLKAVHILPSALTPVCSPHLLERGPPLKEPADLAHFTLLHPTDSHHDWRIWAEEFGHGAININRGQNYSTLDMALKAAMIGVGVAIGDLTLMQDEIASGQLVTPFPDLVFRRESEDYYLYCSKESWNDSRVAAFHSWLIEEQDADYSRNAN